MIWLLLRVFLFVLVVGTIAGLAGLIVDASGQVTFTWNGFQYPPLSHIEFVAVVIVVMGLLFLLYKLTGLLVAVIRFLLGDETALSRYWAAAKERRGLDALSKGMVALAEGDAKEAAGHARKATRLLGHRALTDLLNAQVAEAQGDSRGAKAHYRALAKEPETAIVGVKGLLAQAVRHGERERAMKFAEHAFNIRPKDPEVQQTLFDLQVAEGEWSGALATLAALSKSKALPGDVADRRKAVINLEIARDAKSAGDEKAASKAAFAAVRAAPGLAPAAAFAARQHAAAGEASRAARLLKDAWRLAPQPELAQAFAELSPDEDPSARRRRFRDLIGANPDNDESRYLAAELAIADSDWGAARKALGDLPSTKATHRALALMAAIEKGDGASEAVVRGYLARAVTAPRGAHWVCERCAAAPGAWSATCPNCGGFDTLSWRDSQEAADEAVGAAMLPLMMGETSADRGDHDDRDEQDQLDDAAAEEAVREAADART